MKRFLIYFFVAIISISCSFSTPSDAIKNVSNVTITKKTVLGVGDSWMFYMSENGYDTLRSELPEFNVKTISKSGATAEEMLSEFDWIALAMKLHNPDYIVLSAGGNDMLKYWRADDPELVRNLAIRKSATNVIALVNSIKQVKNIPVIVVGLDYPLLSETEYNLLNEVTRNFYIRVEEPTPIAVNDALIKMGAMIKDSAILSNNFGLMQCTFDSSLKCPSNYPDFDIFAGGDPNKESPVEAMSHVPIILVDSIHLNKDGYKLVSNRINSLIQSL